MAFEQYKDNLKELRDRLRIPDPIQEEHIRVRRIVFTYDSPKEGEPTELVVGATDTNREECLFIEDLAFFAERLVLDQDVRRKAVKFFTLELWGDCSLDKRPLIYGLKTANTMAITYRS